MKNSEKILKTISDFVENGVLTSKDIKKEFSNELKFKKDEILNKLNLVSREEFEVLKKIVQKLSIELEKEKNQKKTKKRSSKTQKNPKNKKKIK